MDDELQGLERRWRETRAPDDRARLAATLERAGRETEAEKHFLDIYRQDPTSPSARAFLGRSPKYTTGYILTDPEHGSLLVVEPGKEPFHVNPKGFRWPPIAFAGSELHLLDSKLGPHVAFTISASGYMGSTCIDEHVVCMIPLAGTEDVGFVHWDIANVRMTLRAGDEEFYAGGNLTPFAHFKDRVLYSSALMDFNPVMDIHEIKHGEEEARRICRYDSRYKPSVAILEGKLYLPGPIDSPGEEDRPEGFFSEHDIDLQSLPLERKVDVRKYELPGNHRLWLPSSLSLFHPEEERIVLDPSQLFRGLEGRMGPFEANILEVPRTITRALYNIHLQQESEKQKPANPPNP